ALMPGTRYVYDFAAFVTTAEPISVRTIRRVYHVNDTAVALSDRDQTLETIEYTDGFGRLLQTRTLAEDVTFGDPIFGDAGLPVKRVPVVADAVGKSVAAGSAPNVVVSGWQIYDNKGRVVEKYEPFYSTGWDYAVPTDAQRGRKAMLYYDPRGHMVK